MPLKFPFSLAAEFADVYAYLKTLTNASRYICLLIRADMEQDPARRFKAALQADLIRLESEQKGG